MKNQKNPENNARDLFIAFVLVMLSYASVGLLGFLAFYDPKKAHGGINQDFLNMFADTNYFAFAAKIALFLQLISVFPTLCFIVRIQFFGLTFKTLYPGFLWVLLLNFVVCTVGVIFSVFYPNIGTILRFVGPISGMIYIFIFPIWIHLINVKQKNGKIGIHWLNLLLVLAGLSALAFQFVPEN